MGDLRKLTRRARRVSLRAEAGAEAGEEAGEEAEAGDDAEEAAGAAAEAAAAGAGAIDPMRGCVGSLRQLLRLSDFVASNLAERQTKADRSEISFHVGQVPRHLTRPTSPRPTSPHPAPPHAAPPRLGRCCATASTATAPPSSAGSAGPRWT